VSWTRIWEDERGSDDDIDASKCDRSSIFGVVCFGPEDAVDGDWIEDISMMIDPDHNKSDIYFGDEKFGKEDGGESCVDCI